MSGAENGHSGSEGYKEKKQEQVTQKGGTSWAAEVAPPI